MMHTWYKSNRDISRQPCGCCMKCPITIVTVVIYCDKWCNVWSSILNLLYLSVKSTLEGFRQRRRKKFKRTWLRVGTKLEKKRANGLKIKMCPSPVPASLDFVVLEFIFTVNYFNPKGGGDWFMLQLHPSRSPCTVYSPVSDCEVRFTVTKWGMTFRSSM